MMDHEVLMDWTHPETQTKQSGRNSALRKAATRDDDEWLRHTQEELREPQGENAGERRRRWR
jgi:hypothetical protein